MWASSMRGYFTLFMLLLLHNEWSAATGNNVEKDVEFQLLPRATIPQSYEIKLVPEIDEGNLTHYGEAKIGVKVLEQTSNVTLHSRDLRIDENFTSLVDANGIAHKPKSHTHAQENWFLIIQFDQPITAGIYTLNLKFASNTTKSSGISKTSRDDEYGQKVWTIFSGMPPRRNAIFPCWDEPDLKATFNLSIKHSSNYTAVSNTPVRYSYIDDDGKRWTNFEVTPPLSTDLVAFVLFDFECLRDGNETINFCGAKDVLPSLKFARHVSEKAFVFMQKHMGFKNNLSKIDLLAVPYWSNYEIIPAWGLVLYRESRVKYEPFKDSLLTKKNLAWTVVSGFIHQWMTSPVTSSSESWEYNWIVSGLSTYLKYYIVDKLYPDWRSLDTMRAIVISNQGLSYYMSDRYMPRDWKTFKGKPQDKFSMFGSEWGSEVFHMLFHIVSEDVFNAGIAKFVNENQHRVITTDDLWNTIHLSYDMKKGSNGDLSIKKIMKPWTEQRGYPILNVTRDYETGKVIITQQSYIANETSSRWWVPINFATKSNPDFSKTTPTHWLKPEEESLVIDGVDKDDWIIVNIQRTGFYRVDYDETNWMRIAKYMNSENYFKIHFLNRAQLLSDLNYMTTLKRQNVTTLLELSKYVSREDDYVPWYAAKEIIGMLKTSILDDGVDAEISNFFLMRVDKFVEKYGFEDRSAYNWEKKYKLFYDSLDNRTKKFVPAEEALEKYYKDDYKDGDFFTNLYRDEILSFVCGLGHRACSDSAKSQLRAHIENPAENPISANLDWWITCYGAEGNEDYVLSLVTDLAKTTYISAVGCSPNKTVLWKYVEDVLSGKLKAGACQLYMAAIGLIPNKDVPRNHTHLNPMVLNVMQNFDRIYHFYINHSLEENFPKNVTSYTAHFLKKYINHIYTLEELKEVNDMKHSIPDAMTSTFDEYISEQNDTINKRIQLADKTPLIVSDWIHHNGSPVPADT